MKTRRPKILVVAKHVSEKYNITDSVRLHRVLYLLDQDYFNQYGDVLFRGGFEAWAYGPVSKKLFKYMNKHEKDFSKVKNLDDQDTIKFIKNNIAQYKKLESYQLVSLTRKSDHYLEARKDVSFGDICTNRIYFR